MVEEEEVGGEGAGVSVGEGLGVVHGQRLVQQRVVGEHVGSTSRGVGEGREGGGEGEDGEAVVSPSRFRLFLLFFFLLLFLHGLLHLLGWLVVILLLGLGLSVRLRRDDFLLLSRGERDDLLSAHGRLLLVGDHSLSLLLTALHLRKEGVAHHLRVARQQRCQAPLHARPGGAHLQAQLAEEEGGQQLHVGAGKAVRVTSTCSDDSCCSMSFSLGKIGASWDRVTRRGQEATGAGEGGGSGGGSLV